MDWMIEETRAALVAESGLLSPGLDAERGGPERRAREILI